MGTGTNGGRVIVLRLRGSGTGYQGIRRIGRRISEKQGIRGQEIRESGYQEAGQAGQGRSE